MIWSLAVWAPLSRIAQTTWALIGIMLCSAVPALAQHSNAKVQLGIDVLERRNFAPIAGQRVGLLTHPAGVNSKGISTINILARTPRVQLVALFGPEHGIYGDEKANVPIHSRTDPATGLPVHSLYGRSQAHP